MGRLVTRRHLTTVWSVGGREGETRAFLTCFCLGQSLKELYLLCSLLWSQILPGSLPLAPRLWAGVKPSPLLSLPFLPFLGVLVASSCC